MRIQKRSNNILIRISASILEALIFNDYLVKSEESDFIFIKLEHGNTIVKNLQSVWIIIRPYLVFYNTTIT